MQESLGIPNSPSTKEKTLWGSQLGLRTAPLWRTLKPKEEGRVGLGVSSGNAPAPGSSRGGSGGTHSAWKERETKWVPCGLFRQGDAGGGGAGCGGSHAPHKPPAARLLASLSVPLSPAVLNRDPNPLRKSISTAQSRDTQSSSPSSQATSRWQNEKKQKSVLGRKYKHGGE